MTSSQDTHKTKLYLPAYCILQIEIRESTQVSESAKIYFGELSVLASKYQHIPYSDEQLSEMKKVSIRTIKRWHVELKEAGFIVSEEKNIPYKNEEEKWLWRNSRRMFLNQTPSKKDHDSAKNVPVDDSAKNVPVDDSAKNVPPSKQEERLESTYNKEVVVFLDQLSLKQDHKIRLSKAHASEKLRICVQSTLAWEGRESDAAAIETILERFDTWNHKPDKQAAKLAAEKLMEVIRLYDGKRVNGTLIVVGNDYVEFSGGVSYYEVFKVEDPSFTTLVNLKLEKLGFWVLKQQN